MRAGMAVREFMGLGVDRGLADYFCLLRRTGGISSWGMARFMN